MNCEAIRDAILEGGHKEEGSHKFIKAHINKCPSCREFARREEDIRRVVIKGLRGREIKTKGGKDFERLFNKKIRAFRGKVALLVSAVVLAALVMLPVIQPTLAHYYPDFFQNLLKIEGEPGFNIEMYLLNRRDEGLLRAGNQAPVLDLSVTDQDITFIVHQFIADSVRVVLIASWEDPKRRIRGGDFSPRLEFPENRIKRWSGSIFTPGREGPCSGIFTFDPFLTPEQPEKVWLEVRSIGNVAGDWSMEVPVFWAGDDQQAISGLSAEKDYFQFTVHEIQPGGTATRVEWEFRDTSLENRAAERGYRLAEKRIQNIGDLWQNAVFWLSLIQQQNHLDLMLNGETVTSYRSHTRSGADRCSISSTGYYPPVENISGLRLILKGIFMQKTDPALFLMEKSGSSWSKPVHVIAGTTVKVEEINPVKGEIVLSYQGGRLMEMDSPTLRDDQGREYRIKHMKGHVEVGDYSFANIIERLEKQQTTVEEEIEYFWSLVKRQTLSFNPFPGDSGSLRLSFDEVLFVSDQEWVIEVP